MNKVHLVDKKTKQNKTLIITSHNIIKGHAYTYVQTYSPIAWVKWLQMDQSQMNAKTPLKLPHPHTRTVVYSKWIQNQVVTFYYICAK